jgi:hypothetical protein
MLSFVLHLLSMLMLIASFADCVDQFRVRKLSEMTEKMSQSLLDTVISVTGSMAAPLIRSKQGRAFLATVPGEVILASLDAISECPAAAAANRF